MSHQSGPWTEERGLVEQAYCSVENKRKRNTKNEEQCRKVPGNVRWPEHHRSECVGGWRAKWR